MNKKTLFAAASSELKNAILICYNPSIKKTEPKENNNKKTKKTVHAKQIEIRTLSPPKKKKQQAKQHLNKSSVSNNEKKGFGPLEHLIKIKTIIRFRV